MNNKEIYSSSVVLEKYSKLNFIFPEEIFLINQIKNKKRNLTFLDIGVGAGRTTSHFHHLSNNYIGIDYSKPMVTYCKNKFQNLNHCTFFALDAGNMHSVNNNSANISFFSFNGIDYVSLEKRIEIFREIKKKTKRNGLFMFSTHNLNYIPNLLKFNAPKNPFKIPSAIYKYFGIRLFNDLNVINQKNDFVQISDGDSNNFNYRTAYINPIFQIKILEEIGFKDIKVVLNEIETTRDQEIIEKLNNPWLHFICKVEK